MSILRLLIAGSIFCLLAVNAQADNNNATLLVGKWKSTTKTGELPLGSEIEFNKDGTMTIATFDDGKVDQKFDATYRVDGFQINFTLLLANKEEKKPPVTIKEISKQALTLKVGGNVTEFKRLK